MESVCAYVSTAYASQSSVHIRQDHTEHETQGQESKCSRVAQVSTVFSETFNPSNEQL